MKKLLDKKFWELVVGQIKTYPFSYGFGFIALVATHLIQSQLPFMARELVKNRGFSNSEIIIFLFLAIGIILFRTASRILFFTPARLMQKELRTELLFELSTATPFRYRQYSSGDIFQYLTQEIEQIRALIGFVGLQLGNIIIAFSILIPRLIHFEIDLLWSLIPMFVCFLIFTFIVSRNKDDFGKMQKALGEIQNNIIESYLGKKTIKNFHAELNFINLFKDASRNELNIFKRTSKNISYSLPLVALGMGLSLIIGAKIIHQKNMSAEDFVLFSGFIFLLMEPINFLSWVGVVISRSSASWDRLRKFKEVLSRPSEIEETIKQKNLIVKSEFILNVPFWDHVVEIDLSHPTWLMFIGPTGVGKSEFLEKLAFLILKNGKKINFVFQDPYLYNETIQTNIFLGRIPLEHEIEMAKKYLKLFGLDYVENNLDQLLALEVGENGKRLSGGQAKRLALVRSLCSHSDYILWDDPFSSIDLILEKEILSQLKSDPYLKNKKFILSGHRLSTLKYVDEICFLSIEKGVLEFGQSNELLVDGTQTYEYFKLQMV